jgi:hypothetical protein
MSASDCRLANGGGTASKPALLRNDGFYEAFQLEEQRLMSVKVRDNEGDFSERRREFSLARSEYE